MKFFHCIQLFCMLFPFSTGAVETDKNLIAVASLWLLLKKKKKQK